MTLTTFLFVIALVPGGTSKPDSPLTETHGSTQVPHLVAAAMWQMSNELAGLVTSMTPAELSEIEPYTNVSLEEAEKASTVNMNRALLIIRRHLNDEARGLMQWEAESRKKDDMIDQREHAEQSLYDTQVARLQHVLAELRNSTQAKLAAHAPEETELEKEEAFLESEVARLMPPVTRPNSTHSNVSHNFSKANGTEFRARVHLHNVTSNTTTDVTNHGKNFTNMNMSRASQLRHTAQAAEEATFTGRANVRLSHANIVNLTHGSQAKQQLKGGLKGVPNMVMKERYHLEGSNSTAATQSNRGLGAHAVGIETRNAARRQALEKAFERLRLARAHRLFNMTHNLVTYLSGKKGTGSSEKRPRRGNDPLPSPKPHANHGDGPATQGLLENKPVKISKNLRSYLMSSTPNYVSQETKKSNDVSGSVFGLGQDWTLDD